MLTKSLVRTKAKGKRIHPEFLDPDDRMLLGQASQFLDLFKESVGMARGQLEEECQTLIDGAEGSTLILRGFEKLLIDRTEFDTASDEEQFVLRETIFQESNTLFKSGTVTDLESYHTELATRTNRPIDQLQTQLYGDLPEFHPVTRFRSLSPERFLHRYNAALVQWMLLHADQLELHLDDPDPAALRTLFRDLRFNQLLAEIEPHKKGGYQVRIDGPLSLFTQTKKYGLSLARFFPAVLPLENWSL
ncbi:MAG: DUF790 family protein, partial [Verrucomicrobiota bacterium]